MAGTTLAYKQQKEHVGKTKPNLDIHIGEKMCPMQVNGNEPHGPGLLYMHFPSILGPVHSWDTFL